MLHGDINTGVSETGTGLDNPPVAAFLLAALAEATACRKAAEDFGELVASGLGTADTLWAGCLSVVGFKVLERAEDEAEGATVFPVDRDLRSRPRSLSMGALALV